MALCYFLICSSGKLFIKQYQIKSQICLSLTVNFIGTKSGWCFSLHLPRVFAINTFVRYIEANRSVYSNGKLWFDLTHISDIEPLPQVSTGHTHADTQLSNHFTDTVMCFIIFMQIYQPFISTCVFYKHFTLVLWTYYYYFFLSDYLSITLRSSCTYTLKLKRFSWSGQRSC